MLEGAIGSQIQNATSILANTIQENIAKASIENTKALKNQADQEKNLYENRMKYDEQQQKGLQLAEEKNKIAADLDIAKLNSTNACGSPGVALRQAMGQVNTNVVSSGGGQIARNYNTGIEASGDVVKVYEELLIPKDGSKPLDDLQPVTNFAPKVLSKEQVELQIKANALYANPVQTPAIPDDNPKLKASPAGKRYETAKTLLDKKAETIAQVLNDKVAFETPTILDANSMNNEFIMKYLNTEYETQFKDSEGNPVINKLITPDNETSMSALLAAQVAQYHSNSDWHTTISGNSSLSTKVEQLAKIMALQLDISHRTYQQTMMANVLKAFDMQKDMVSDGEALSGAFDALQD